MICRKSRHRSNIGIIAGSIFLKHLYLFHVLFIYGEERKKNKKWVNFSFFFLTLLIILTWLEVCRFIKYVSREI